VDSTFSHCWVLETCCRARAGHLRPAVLVACFSVGDVHCRNVSVCECHWDAVSADHDAYCCLYRDVSLAHHVQCYAFQTWKLLSSVWTAKDFARDASTLAKLGWSEHRLYPYHGATRKTGPDSASICRVFAHRQSHAR
jgi:hypothetical protein